MPFHSSHLVASSWFILKTFTCFVVRCCIPNGTVTCLTLKIRLSTQICPTTLPIPVPSKAVSQPCSIQSLLTRKIFSLNRITYFLMHIVNALLDTLCSHPWFLFSLLYYFNVFCLLCVIFLWELFTFLL